LARGVRLENRHPTDTPSQKGFNSDTLENLSKFKAAAYGSSDFFVKKRLARDKVQVTLDESACLPISPDTRRYNTTSPLAGNISERTMQWNK
jgi:hypothetical protein